MKKETLLHFMDLSNRFSCQVWEAATDLAMQEQQFYADDAGIKGYRLHDHYTSFFLTVENAAEVINSFANSGYYYSDLPETKKAAAALKRFEEMNYWNKNFDMLEEWLHGQAEKLLHIYENDLHSYEDSDFILNNYCDYLEDDDWEEYKNYYEKDGRLYLHHEPAAAWEELVK